MDLQKDPSFFFHTQYLSSVGFLKKTKKHLKQEYHNKAKKVI